MADSAAGIRCTQCHDLILANFNLAVGLSICQTAKLKISSYTVYTLGDMTYLDIITIDHEPGYKGGNPPISIDYE